MAESGALDGLRLGTAQSVLDRLRAAVIATDLEGRLLYANPHAVQLYGWTTAGPIVGTNVGELNKFDVSEAQAHEIAAALRAGQPWEGDFRLVRPDGVELLVHAADTGLFDGDGQLVGVVSVVTDITEQQQAFETLTNEAEVLRFLLDATTVVAGAMAYEEALDRLAQLAVPVLGDLCLIDALEDGAIVRMAAAHADPSQAPLVQELFEHYPPDPAGSHPAVVTMRDGVSFISPIMTERFLAATTRDERHLEIVGQLGFRSYMCAPLRARDRVLGSVTIVSAGSGRVFDEDDLALAQELANRAGLVIDNARLLAERTRTARALQAALLPPVLPAIDGVDIGARYRAAGAGAEVGGDFYDVFSSGHDTWTAVVGDVCGTGPDAAAAAGIVRHALHAAALRASDPISMLDTADELLEHHQPTSDVSFCSACCAVLETGARGLAVTVASAGHPEPWVLRADGQLEPVSARGSLLGIGLERHRALARVELAPGDILLLYTDGVTEARSRDGAFFVESCWPAVLRRLDRSTADAFAGALLDAVDSFTDGDLRDDLAILVVAPR